MYTYFLFYVSGMEECEQCVEQCRQLLQRNGKYNTALILPAFLTHYGLLD